MSTTIGCCLGALQRSQLGRLAGCSGKSSRASIQFYNRQIPCRRGQHGLGKLSKGRLGGRREWSPRLRCEARKPEGDTGEEDVFVPTPLPQKKPIAENKPRWVEEFADPLQDSVESQLAGGDAGVGFFGLVSESELASDDGLPLLRQNDTGTKQSDIGVPMYVALPLEAISQDNKLQSQKALRAALRALKLIGVEGVCANVVRNFSSCMWGSIETI